MLPYTVAGAHTVDVFGIPVWQVVFVNIWVLSRFDLAFVSRQPNVPCSPRQGRRVRRRKNELDGRFNFVVCDTGPGVLRVLSCKCLHNDFIQNIFLFHSRDRRYYAEKARGAALKIENGVICC